MLEFGKFLLAAFFMVSGVVIVFRLFKIGKELDQLDRDYKRDQLELLQNIDASLTCIDLELRNAKEVQK